MNESIRQSFVPASLVRIRCFLNRRGMKVKPWLGPEGILDAFYTTLRAQGKSEDFWLELRRLLGNLADDMNQRIQRRGWVIDNELLDQNCHESLLTEIREALGDGRAAGNLTSFAVALPRRAGALLLMLAAAMVVGCGGEGGSADGDQSYGGSAAASGGAANGGSGTASGGAANGGTPTPVGGQASGGTSSTQSTYPCPNPGVPSGLDPNRFASCNQQLVAALIPYDLHTNSGEQLLECACLLNDAWQTGLANLFSGKDCGEIASYFSCCGFGDPRSANTTTAITNFCRDQQNQALPADFDSSLLFDNSCCLIYLGVRCD
jgi:hypothetical protein